MGYKVTYLNVRPDRYGKSSSIFKNLGGRFGAEGFKKHLQEAGHKNIRIIKFKGAKKL